MTTLYDLPKPNAQALKRSKLLFECIQQEINKRGGQISFAEYMELTQYHSELGYYNNVFFTLGRAGDFTTAPEISPLFAKCFAKQVSQLFEQWNNNQCEILELGAGTGRFAHDLLLELNQHHCLPQYYFIYEKSLELRKKQQSFLKSNNPFFNQIVWLETLPVNFSGIIIANEVLDALPTHLFCIENNELKERCVSIEENKLVWRLSAPISKGLVEKVANIQKLYALVHGYAAEINLALPQFIKSLANSLTKGILLFADYGYGQREYYHPDRRQGTLTCFYQHRHHDNPLILPGLQDITTHVDFTAVIESAVDNGCRLAGYTSQAAFLFACGLVELATQEEKNLTELEQFNLHQAIKLLTFPTEMGERIKVMALSKNIDVSLLGFSLLDKSREL